MRVISNRVDTVVCMLDREPKKMCELSLAVTSAIHVYAAAVFREQVFGHTFETRAPEEIGNGNKIARLGVLETGSLPHKASGWAVRNSSARRSERHDGISYS